MLGCFGWLIYVLANINEVGIGWQVPAFCLTLFVAYGVPRRALRAEAPPALAHELLPDDFSAARWAASSWPWSHRMSSTPTRNSRGPAAPAPCWVAGLPAGLAVPDFQWWRFHAWMPARRGDGRVPRVLRQSRAGQRGRGHAQLYGAMSVLEYGSDTPGSRYLLLQHGRITHGLRSPTRPAPPHHELLRRAERRGAGHPNFPRLRSASAWWASAPHDGGVRQQR